MFRLFSRKKTTLQSLTQNLSTVVGLVLIWRGIWYVLDVIDVWLFGSYHIWTALAGIVIGLLLLYLPDKDLKEIENL